MVTRSRDLDVFSYADRNDVSLVDCGQGLQFVAFGAIPERRLLLEAVYGFLTLKNGVPIGYVLARAPSPLVQGALHTLSAPPPVGVRPPPPPTVAEAVLATPPQP